MEPILNLVVSLYSKRLKRRHEKEFSKLTREEIKAALLRHVGKNFDRAWPMEDMNND